jgi:archaellum biogenesis protein FlaJ (TadC family)
MEKWTKRYYQLLISGLLAFAILLLLIGMRGPSRAMLVLSFFVFYLAYKNGLQAWVKNQIAKEDPAFKNQMAENRQQKRAMWKIYLLPRSPWYKNESIALVLILLLAFYFGIR